jgi:Tetracyclin repressor-like, C-terminal domain
VVQARGDEVRRVIERGIARGDLPVGTDSDVATDALIGPIYFRLVFGGALDREFGEKVVDTLLPKEFGHGRPSAPHP